MSWFDDQNVEHVPYEQGGIRGGQPVQVQAPGLQTNAAPVGLGSGPAGAGVLGGIATAMATTPQAAADGMAPTLAAMQTRPQPFDLTGASVHGRPAKTDDPNDLMYLASQQPGFDISSTEAAQRTFQNIIQPLYAQQGMQAQLGGKNNDRIMAGGHTIDFIQNSSAKDPSQRRMQAYEANNGQNGPGGGAPGAPGDGQVPIDGGGQAFPAGGGGGYGGYGGSTGTFSSSTPNVLTGTGQFDPYSYEAFKAPDAFKSPGAFKAPGAEGLENDPGYQFRLKQGQQAITNSAAAKGLLHSSNAIKGFSDYNQDAASQEYDKVYGRSLGEYQQNYNQQLGEYQQNYNQGLQANQVNNAGRLAGFNANTNVALGQGNLNLGYQNSNNQYALGQGQLALGNKTADQNYNLGQGQLGLGYQNSNNSFQLGLGQQQLGWANYGLGADQQQFFQNYQFPVQTGLQAAQYGSQYAGQYGANGANNATGAGNAAAAGRVGSANAWNQGLTGAFNAGAGAYGAYQAGRPARPAVPPEQFAL